MAEATRDLAATLGELEETYQTTLEALGSALDTRDLGTELHSRRVRGYSLALARAHGVPTGSSSTRSSTACSCTTSARSASPTRSSSSRAP